MTDYSNLGLNQFLQPNSSPVNTSNFVNAYEFNSNNERGAITNAFIQDASINNAKIGTAAIGTANIGTLTFNEISGGTATFGGTANGNGLVEVLNQAGGTVVKIDKDGITVTNGSISLKNSAGTTIMDSTGLISAANFAANGTLNSSSRSFTSGSFTDVPNTSINIIVPRATQVLIGAIARAKMEGLTGTDIDIMTTYMNIGGTVIQPGMQIRDTRLETPSIFSTDSRTYSLAFSSIENISAGTTTVKLQVTYSPTSDGNGDISYTSVYYVVLGS